MNIIAMIKKRMIFIKRLIIIIFLIVIGAWLKPNEQTNTIINIINNITAALIFECMHTYVMYKKYTKVLNLLLNSLIEAFYCGVICQHEKSIINVKNYMNLSKLDDIENKLKEFEFGIFDVKILLETADSRFSDFQHSLTIASQISADHALIWLALIDKVRLLVDEYQIFIKIENKNISAHRLKEIKNNPCLANNQIEKLIIDFVFRLEEFLELSKRFART